MFRFIISYSKSESNLNSKSDSQNTRIAFWNVSKKVTDTGNQTIWNVECIEFRIPSLSGWFELTTTWIIPGFESFLIYFGPICVVHINFPFGLLQYFHPHRSILPSEWRSPEEGSTYFH